MECGNDPCVLLFSGGRDSTIASIRLAETCSRLELVTVSTPHLFGIERVIRRLLHLRKLISPEVEWHHLTYTNETSTGEELLETCLPCHSTYAAAGCHVADRYGISRLAFGYSGYQSDWAEQTSLAKEALVRTLARFGKDVAFPVEDIRSKDQAKKVLLAHGLDGDASEQKCSKQQRNLPSDAEGLESEILRWSTDLERAIKSSREALRIERVVRLGDLIEEAPSWFPII